MGYSSNMGGSFGSSKRLDTAALSGDLNLVTYRPGYGVGDDTRDEKLAIGVVVTVLATDPSALILQDGQGNADTHNIPAAALPYYIPGRFSAVTDTGTTSGIVMNVWYE
jgi:hypothetical protein